MRTAEKSQSGRGVRARAKVSFHGVKVGAGAYGVCKLREGGQCPGGPRDRGFLTSARAGHKVVPDIQRVLGLHLSRDGVETQELVPPEAVVAAEPSQGRGAVPDGWPGTLLCGVCGQVPEPRVCAFVRSTNKHSVRPGYALPCPLLGPRMDQMWFWSPGVHSPAGRQSRKVIIQ